MAALRHPPLNRAIIVAFAHAFRGPWNAADWGQWKSEACAQRWFAERFWLVVWRLRACSVGRAAHPPNQWCVGHARIELLSSLCPSVSTCQSLYALPARYCLHAFHVHVGTRSKAALIDQAQTAQLVDSLASWTPVVYARTASKVVGIMHVEEAVAAINNVPVCLCVHRQPSPFPRPQEYNTHTFSVPPGPCARRRPPIHLPTGSRNKTCTHSRALSTRTL